MAKSKIKGGKPKDLALFRRDGSARTAGAVTANKGGYKIADTSTTAKVGDFYRAESGTAALLYVELPIIEANTNDFTIASKVAPTAADTFFILGPATPRVDSTGAIGVSVAGGATEAKQDTQITHLSAIETATEAIQANNFSQLGDINTSVNTLLKPASTLAAVTNLAQLGGQAVAMGTGVRSAGTQRVTVATDDLVPISAASLPLPSGAATAALQTSTSSTLDTSINTLLKPASTLTAVTTVTTVGTVTNITNQGQLVDNAAFTDGTTRLNMSGYIFDEVAGTALTENDAAASRIDSKRAQVMVIEDATTRGQRQAVSAAGAASSNIAQIAGTTAVAGAGPTGAGSIRVTEANVATATLANVASSATNVTLLASAAARMHATFFNESTATLYLKFGATASATSYTVAIAPGGYYELPQPCYSGIIDGIWSAANGTCRVTSW